MTSHRENMESDHIGKMDFGWHLPRPGTLRVLTHPQLALMHRVKMVESPYRTCLECKGH